MKRVVALVAALVVLALAAPHAEAHVGSPDAVADGRAGPYHLLTTIRPPEVIPGVARIEIRALDGDVGRLTVVPLPMSGPGVSSPPTADVARRSVEDPNLYTSTLWLMRTGAWQVRITAAGARGEGVLSIPVPALARGVRPMSPLLGGLLVALLGLLVVGIVAIVGASVREGDLDAGAAPDARRRARGRVAMGVAAAAMAAAIVGMNGWWTDEASFYRRLVYKPLKVEVERPTPHSLTLALVDPGWLRWRRTDDLIPDHGHLLHLFAVRAPGLDAIAHLHPARDDAGLFRQDLPPVPEGLYRLYGDVVHKSGLDETATATLELDEGPPPVPADRFDPDDASAEIPRAATAAAPSFAFPDGSGRLRWVDPRPPRAGETVALELEAEDAAGRPVDGLEPYMGMAGHAMIVARDFSVFAHVHPTGSVPMAALALVDPAAVVDHAHHAGMTFAPRVRFPYVFPRPGSYRLFVQIKRSGRIETAAYDVDVLDVAPAAAGSAGR
jgi:hypothetical protein